MGLYRAGELGEEVNAVHRVGILLRALLSRHVLSGPPPSPFSSGNLYASQGHPLAAVLCVARGVRMYSPPFPVDRSSMSRVRSFRVSCVLSEVS